MKKIHFLLCFIITLVFTTLNLFANDFPFDNEWEDPFVSKDGSNLPYFISLASKPKYSFSYDQEIPFALKRGSHLSGLWSHSGYFSFITWNGNSFTSFDVGYNVTAYDLSPPITYNTILNSIALGYIPLIPEFLYGYSCYNYKQDYNSVLQLGSPFIGFSYTERNKDRPYYIIFSINVGPVYVPTMSPYGYESAAQENFVNYEKHLRSYEIMKNISNKWGARINVKARFFSSDLAEHGWNIGLGVGLTQYIFKNNFFNSFEVGPVIMCMF